MTPAEELSSQMVHKVENAQQRMEFIRKIGLHNMLEELDAETIDESEDGTYRLYMLAVEGRDGEQNATKHPYLGMKNPSTGHWHVEGVEDGIKTVLEALQWRNQEEDLPITLT